MTFLNRNDIGRSTRGLTPFGSRIGPDRVACRAFSLTFSFVTKLRSHARLAFNLLTPRVGLPTATVAYRLSGNHSLPTQGPTMQRLPLVLAFSTFLGIAVPVQAATLVSVSL